jgi:hypothetical protein
MRTDATKNSEKNIFLATLKWIATAGSSRKTAKKSPKETSKKEEEKPAWKGPIPLFDKDTTKP